MGASEGVGTTYVSISLAYYCTKVLRKKTAFIELSGAGDLKKIVPGERCFQLDQITCYAQVRREEIPEILNHAEEIYILDMGADYRNNRLEFLRCDVKILVGSMCLWKRNDLLERLGELSKEANMKQWLHCLIQFGEKEDKKEIRKKYQIAVQNMPYMRSPYDPNKEVTDIFARWVKR